MKTITIKQPYAYLICSGLKDIENRTWPTKFRGRVLIHASAKPVKLNPLYVQWRKLSYGQRMLVESNLLPNSAIIGSVEIVDCVINHSSIWAEKSYQHFAEEQKKPISEQIIYNWVLANPILFDNPIPAKGKLSFWDFPDITDHIQV